MGEKVRNKEKTSWIVHLFFVLYAVICIVPLMVVITASLSSEKNLVKYGFSVWPRELDLTAYQYLFAKPELIWNAYKVTIFVTAVGTFLSVLIMAMCAYALSRPRYKFRGLITALIYFPVLFNAGLSPSYIVNTRYLHLQDSMLVLILPGLVNAFHIFMLRTFFKQLPDGLFDAAKVDGASETRIFFGIALSLSKPVIATVAFLGALTRWNAWEGAMLYIQSENKYPLQYLLQRMMKNVEAILKAVEQGQNTANLESIPGENLRMALLVVCIGPMMCLFPFFQKYFTKGMTVGAVKG